MDKRDDGFTLIELLVVIIIIGILASIAIPVYLNQREKGWRSQAVSDMKNAATSVESLATENAGSYLAANGLDETSPVLLNEGFRPGSLVSVQVTATASSYCIRGLHTNLSEEFVYRNGDGIVKSGAPGFLAC
jgi:type IV pilus assembly protein PilA